MPRFAEMILLLIMLALALGANIVVDAMVRADRVAMGPPL